MSPLCLVHPETVALAAATATPRTYALGGAARVCVLLKNTGANAIGTTTVELSPTGANFAEDVALGTAIGSLAAGATKLVELFDQAGASLRLTFTSALGSSVLVEIRGS